MLLDSIKTIRDKYGYSKVEEIELLQTIDRQAMAHFVEKSFVEWGWSDNETHLQEISEFMETCDNIADPGRKRLYKMLVLAMKSERNKFRRQFEKEFLFTRRGYVKGIRFFPDTQEFQARMEYKERDPDTKELVKREMTCNVTDRWMRDEFPHDIIKHVVDMAVEEDDFIAVPDGVSFQLLDKKITRVRYQPSQQRYILDAEKIREIGEDALREQRLARKREELAGTRKSGRRQNKVDDLPRKLVITEPRWVVKFADKKTMVVGEELIRENFGDRFTDELLSLRRGFVDIPVGDNKPSHLHLYPHLICDNAPVVIFTQSFGRDLCVPKALASVLYQLGFKMEAMKIDSYGESCLHGGTVDALSKVAQYATKTLPTWLQMRNLPRNFHWKTMVQQEDVTTILLGVISASDGSNSHAVAIHGGYIYDANETIAIPLSQEALDYCASTPTVQSRFVNFVKGRMFAYVGQKPGKLSRMMLKTYTTSLD